MGGQPPVSPEEVKAWNPSCVGVARTHSLLVGWYVGDFNEQRTRQWVGVLNRPPVVQPDPQWIVHVDARVMMPTLAKGEMGPDYEAVESGISAFLESLLLPRDAFPYTGWYEWGKHPDLRYEKANTLVFAQWWRLNNLNYYYYSWNLSHLWMRTGERKFLQELEKVNNFLADNSMIHWDGGSSHKLRGYLLHGSRPFAPIYWDSTKNVLNEGGSTESITGFAYEYFLRDNRNYLDIFSNMTRVFVSDFKNEYYDTADTTLAMMCGLYRVTQDAALLEKIKSYFRAMTDSNSDIGLNEEFWKTRGNALYKSFRKAFNFLQYYDLTGDDAARSVIVKLQVKNVYAEPYMQPFYYQHRNGAIFGRLYEWTNDDDCLYWARHQLSGAKELFEKFFALPPESRGMAHLLKNMPGPGATGGSGGQFIFDGVTFESSGLLRGKGRLYFGGDAFPAAISLPMALWAIKGFPDSAE